MAHFHLFPLPRCFSGIAEERKHEAHLLAQLQQQQQQQQSKAATHPSANGLPVGSSSDRLALGRVTQEPSTADKKSAASTTEARAQDSSPHPPATEVAARLEAELEEALEEAAQARWVL